MMHQSSQGWRFGTSDEVRSGAHGAFDDRDDNGHVWHLFPRIDDGSELAAAAEFVLS
jgi:hypothetical protein